MKQPGHLYVCDRAERAHASGEKTEQFVQEGDKAGDAWRTVVWTDGNGVERKMLICPECVEKYASIEETHQNDMREFEEEGLY